MELHSIKTISPLTILYGDIFSQKVIDHIKKDRFELSGNDSCVYNKLP